MKYGLPYKGSKNKLAERIVHLLPKRKNLVDLFCGGCAVSHAALLMGKYEHIHINDLNWMCPTLFMDALAGKYNNETRWISREDFFRLRDTDPYVAVVWSFGNNLRKYLYSKDIEPLKKAIHYAIFFSDYSLAKELGHDLSFIDPIQGTQKRYLAVKHYFNRLGHFQQQSFEGGRIAELNKSNTYRGGGESSRLQSAEAHDRLITNLQNWGYQETPSDWRQPKDLQASVRIATPGMCQPSAAIQKKKKSTRRNPQCRASQQHCIACNTASDSTACLTSIRGWQILPITSSVLDYAEVEIPKDSVIYCDIPYEGTDVYNGAEQFDYDRFYRWAENQSEPVFISSYQMPPDRFDCIAEFSHRSTFAQRNNNAVVERIFVPKHQKERGNIARQLSLFD